MTWRDWWRAETPTIVELWKRFQITAAVHKDGQVWTIPPPKYLEIAAHESESRR